MTRKWKPPALPCTGNITQISRQSFVRSNPEKIAELSNNVIQQLRKKGFAWIDSDGGHQIGTLVIVLELKDSFQESAIS
jgi:hypothetical protein